MGQASTTFYVALSDRLSIPEEHREGAVRFFQTWQRVEGGTSEHNPFNTTYGEPGATNYNSVGVKNFPTEAEGVDATANTLLHGAPSYGYDHIIYALRDGNFAAAARAVDASSWGTHGLAEAYGSGGASSGGGQTSAGGHAHANVAALQGFLAAHGHAPANSYTAQHTWDGRYGPGTQHALEAFLRGGRENVAALQGFLAAHGHAPANSRKGNGWDGIYGPGTQAAVTAFIKG